MSKNRFRLAVAAIFVLALAVRLAHVWQIRSAPFFSALMGDSRGYDEWAQRIAGGDWLGREVFYQAPLYPYLLGAIYAIAGRSLLLVRIVQAAIGSASCALLALAASRLFSTREVGPRPVEGRQAQDRPELGRKAGLAAGVMLAFYAPAIFFDALLQKSVLDVFFVCLALWLIAGLQVRLKADPTKGKALHHTTERAVTAKAVRGVRLQPDLHWLWLGLAMGGLALTRENAIVLIAVIGLWTLAMHRLKAAAIFVLGVGLVLVPVAARNAWVGGGFYITTSQAGPNFYIGNNPKADGTYQSLRFGRGAPEYERQDATELAEHALGRGLTPAEVSSYWTGRAFDYISSQPVAWLKLMARKTALLLNAAEIVDTESQETHAEWSLPLRLLGHIGHFGVLVPLAIFGLIATWPIPGARERSRFWLLYALAAAYAASVVMFYIFARYRYPLVPFLMLFAAAGIVSLPGVVRARSAPGGVWTLAVVAVSAVVSNWPLLSTAWMQAVTEGNLGAALQSEQRLDEAAAHYRRAIAFRPDYAPAYSNLGTALRAQGRLDEAAASYRHAIDLQPEYPDAHYNLANALVEQGKTDAAIEHFQIALRAVPGSAEVHNNLGIALAAKGRTDEAVAQFRAALAADARSAKAHRNLADLLASEGRRDEAVDHLRQATALAPDDAATQYDFGSLLLEAGRLDEAVKAFRAALALAPSSAETHNNLGIALGSQGRLDEAIDQFRQALQIKPNLADARRNLAMALQNEKP